MSLISAAKEKAESPSDRNDLGARPLRSRAAGRGPIGQVFRPQISAWTRSPGAKGKGYQRAHPLSTQNACGARLIRNDVEPGEVAAVEATVAGKDPTGMKLRVRTNKEIGYEVLAETYCVAATGTVHFILCATRCAY